MPNNQSEKSPQEKSGDDKNKRKSFDLELDGLFAAKKKKQKAAVPPPKKKQTRKETSKNNDWVDDGLGGKYNAEGYTGRVVDGVRIFKAHMLSQKKNAGQTPRCPFDCDCCFI